MSGNIIRPQFGPKPPVTTDLHFGGCSECGKTDGYVDHGRDHWFCCDAHRTRWYVGSNLFSSWREDQSQEEVAATAKVMSYRVVEPVRMPAPLRDDLPPPMVVRTPREFGQILDDLMADLEEGR